MQLGTGTSLFCLSQYAILFCYLSALPYKSISSRMSIDKKIKENKIKGKTIFKTKRKEKEY